MVATFFIQIHNARLGNDMKYHEMTSSLSLSLSVRHWQVSVRPLGVPGLTQQCWTDAKQANQWKRYQKWNDFLYANDI